MGKHARLLQSLETQAQPLRWLLLDCLAQEYPGRMAGIRAIRFALLPHLAHYEDKSFITATGVRLAYWEWVAPHVNEWASGLGFHDTDQVTPEFCAWLAEAAVQCSIHLLAGGEPAHAVSTIARVESALFEVSYTELPDDPCPVPPEYNPDVLTGPKYLERVEQYMSQAEGWFKRHGAVRAPKRDPGTVESHLLWIAWGLVDGLTDEAVAERFQERTGSVIGGDTVAALYRPQGIATVLGILRN